MCIAIFKPKEVVLTKTLLKTCFKNNPDGAGFAYPSKKQDKVIIEKGFFTFRAFWLRYRDVQARERAMLIHFRVATSGVIDADNCHPWRIDNEHAMIHNGVIQGKLGLQADNCSDTGLFVKHVLQPTFSSNQEVWKTPAYKWIMQESIGIKNKVAILDSKGFAVIYNDKEGQWECGAWFSNDTFKTARKTMAKIGDSWVETRPDGSKWSAKRKNGHTISYLPIKNGLDVGASKGVLALPARPTLDKKIIDFASRQTGVKIGNSTMPKPPSICSSTITLAAELEEEVLAAKEAQAVLKSREIDVSMMY